MFIASMLALIATLLMALARALMGPSTYDRILAVNAAGTVVVLFIAVLGFLTARPDFLDIALVYALINFIGTIAVLKFIKFGNFAHGGPQDSQPAANDPDPQARSDDARPPR